jgi:hypothetical protein
MLGVDVGLKFQGPKLSMVSEIKNSSGGVNSSLALENSMCITELMLGGLSDQKMLLYLR